MAIAKRYNVKPVQRCQETLIMTVSVGDKTSFPTLDNKHSENNQKYYCMVADVNRMPVAVPVYIVNSPTMHQLLMTNKIDKPKILFMYLSYRLKQTNQSYRNQMKIVKQITK